MPEINHRSSSEGYPFPKRATELHRGRHAGICSFQQSIRTSGLVSSWFAGAGDWTVTAFTHLVPGDVSGFHCVVDTTKSNLNNLEALGTVITLCHDALASAESRSIVESTEHLSLPAELIGVPVEYSTSSAPWRDDVKRRIQRLQAIPEDWDAGRAASVQEEATQRAILLLDDIADASTPEPHVGPTYLGGVQLEWHRKGFDLEIALDPEGAHPYVFFQKVPHDVVHDGVVKDLETLRAFVRSISD